MWARSARIAVVSIGVALGLSHVARADEPSATPSTAQATTPKLTWDPSLPRFRPAEWGATGALLGGVIVLALEDRYRPSQIHGGILFDDAVRSALEAKSPAGRERAQHVGTAIYASAIPISIADALIAAWAVNGSSDVTGQLVLMDAEAYALVGFEQFLAAALVRRERPYGAQCRAGRDEGFPGCVPQDPDASKSFFAGHAAITFTSAGLTCAHHTHLSLYGSIGDPSICAFTIASAFVVAYTRIAADKHYATDDLTGMLLGASAGYLLPTLLHYRATSPVPPPAGSRDEPRVLGVMPTVGPSSAGAVVLGTF